MIPLKEKDVKALGQLDDYQNGEQYFRQGKVADTWQTETSLHASVAGSGKKPYQVSIALQGATLAPKCTCPAHRRRPFCKHVVAVLIAWAQTPERFVLGEAPPRPKPQSQAQRTRKPKTDQRQVQAEGLAKIENLLVELIAYGLLSLTEEQVGRVNDLAHTAESHKLRRLARQVRLLGTMLETARTNQEQFAEASYAELLSNTWLTAQATRRALDAPQADLTLLDELVGKIWREKDLERREGVRLLELAYETVELDTGFLVATSYLLNLDDGTLYAEKQIMPAQLKKQARKPSYTGRIDGIIGLYPGPEPRRVKLIEIAPETPLADADWQQALACAGRSVEALFRHFQMITANPLVPREDYAFFAPAQIFVDAPCVYLLDGDRYSLSLAEGWRVLRHVARDLVMAFFGRLTLVEGTLRMTPLGLVTAPPGTKLIRISI